MSKDGHLVVARVVTRLNVGGPTRHVAALAAGLDPGRFRQILLHGRADDDESDGLLDVPGEKLRIDELRRAPHPLRDRAAFVRLRDAFRRLRPDVVHTHQGKAGALGRFAARAAGVACVVHTHHGLVFDGYFSAAGRALYRAIERAAARRSDALIVQATSQAEVLRRELGRAAGRIFVVPPGVDVARFLAPPREPTKPPGPYRVLVPARLAPVKDPWLALDVARRLPAGFEFTFLGDGPLRAAVLEAIAAEPRLRGRTFVRPPVADPRGDYAASDVVLLTSRSEGTPLVLIEAQLAGTPVVATDVGATASVIATGGGVVRARDAAALADAVIATAGRRLGPETTAEVVRRFSANRLCEDVAALYETLVSEAAGPGSLSRRRRP